MEFQPIKDNPFHILGITADASAKTINKRKANATAYHKVGKAITFNDDILLDKGLDRSSENFNVALSKLDKNEQKLHHALFWFTNQQKVDSIAIDHLRKGNALKAKELWEKTVGSKSLNNKNISAFNNLGTINLILANADWGIEVDEQTEALYYKVELMTSSHFHGFAQLVTDGTMKVDGEKQLQIFLQNLLELPEYEKISRREIPKFFKDSHPQALPVVRPYLNSEATGKIDRSVKHAQGERQNDQKSSLQAGKNLYNSAKEELALLVKANGFEDPTVKSYGDKISSEVLECAIDFYNSEDKNANYFSESPAKNALEVVQLAENLAQGEVTKDRIARSKSTLKEQLEFEEIKAYIDSLKNDLSSFKAGKFNVENARLLLNRSIPNLQKIKKQLGGNNDFYIDISTAVFQVCQQMLVKDINDKQESLSMYQQADDYFLDFQKALKVSNNLGELHLDSESRNWHNRNHKALEEIKHKLDNLRRRAKPSPQPEPPKPNPGPGPPNPPDAHDNPESDSLLSESKARSNVNPRPTSNQAKDDEYPYGCIILAAIGLIFFFFILANS